MAEPDQEEPGRGFQDLGKDEGYLQNHHGRDHGQQPADHLGDGGAGYLEAIGDAGLDDIEVVLTQFEDALAVLLERRMVFAGAGHGFQPIGASGSTLIAEELLDFLDEVFAVLDSHYTGA